MQIIVNPTSRKGRAEKLTQLVTSALDDLNITYTLKYTSRPGEATEIAKAAADLNEDMLLCIGGDGTVSETAGGLVNSNTVLGIIPAGTGDDFARYLGIPSNPLEALNCALWGDTRRIDAALANDRVFINSAGSGFDVQVLNHTLRYKKVFHGLFAYVLGVLTSIFGYRGMQIFIRHVGGEIKTRSLILNVANGRYMGGGMCVSPLADAEDGLFDVIYVDMINMFKIPFLLAAFIKGSHISWPFVHTFRTDELTVTVSDGFLQLDGEIFSENTVRYKILPRAVAVKVPVAVTAENRAEEKAAV